MRPLQRGLRLRERLADDARHRADRALVDGGERPVIRKNRYQAATANPCGSIAPEGSIDDGPTREMFFDAPQTPDGERIAAWTKYESAPLKRCQTAIAAPFGFIAICGSPAFWPTAERSSGSCQMPLATGRDAAWMMSFVPFERCHTAIDVAVLVARELLLGRVLAERRDVLRKRVPDAGRRTRRGLDDAVRPIPAAPDRNRLVSGPRTTWGVRSAFRLSIETSCGAPQAPPAGR